MLNQKNENLIQLVCDGDSSNLESNVTRERYTIGSMLDLYNEEQK